MTDHNHLRSLLEDAAADVPAPHMTATVVAGARRRRTRHRIVAGTALAAVGVAGFGATLPAFEPDGGGDVHVANGPLGGSAERATVADEFTCGHTLTVPSRPPLGEVFGHGPDFGVGLYGAQRYEVIDAGPDRKVLQVGDADGTLTAQVNLRSGADASWVIDGYERCTGPQGSAVPVNKPFQLGAHGRALPAPDLATPDAGDPSSEAPVSSLLTIDDRPFYNRLGVVQRRTLFAYETDGGVAVADAVDGNLGGSVSWAAGDAPTDLLGPYFIPPTDPGLEPDTHFAGWVFYTLDDATLTGTLDDGREIAADTFRGDDWKGTLHVLLAPAEDLDSVTLEQDGRTKTVEVTTP